MGRFHIREDKMGCKTGLIKGVLHETEIQTDKKPDCNAMCQFKEEILRKMEEF